MKKAIFWDSDGTLLYGNESFKCSLMRAFETYGYAVKDDEAKNFMRSVCSWYVPEKDHSDKDGEAWWNELLGEVFERLGLGEEIAGYFCSASVGYEKPRKEIFEYAIEKVGNPEVKYMIGDNPVADYQGGLEAGLTPILVHCVQEGKRCCENLKELANVITD